MTRTEQIENAAKQWGDVTYGNNGTSEFDEAFIKGAEWADAHQDYAEVNKFFAKIITEQNLQLREVLQSLAKRHDWMPGMGQCICSPHLKARELLERV